MNAPIYFQFTDRKAAFLALDTLQELEYTVHMMEAEDAGRLPVLQIYVEQGDLTSALEITQAHGGTLLEDGAGFETDVYASAYALDGIAIPAHLVADEEPHVRDERDETWNPAGIEANAFDAGIRL